MIKLKKLLEIDNDKLKIIILGDKETSGLHRCEIIFSLKDKNIKNPFLNIEKIKTAISKSIDNKNLNALDIINEILTDTDNVEI